METNQVTIYICVKMIIAMEVQADNDHTSRKEVPIPSLRILQDC